MAPDLVERPDTYYEARAARHEAERVRARRVADRVSVLRLTSLVALFVVTAWVSRSPIGRASSAAAPVCAGVLAVVFGWFVRAHGRARARENDAARRRAVCLRGVARVRRTWKELRDAAWPLGASADRAALSTDLHVAGRGSLAQLLDVVTPAVGGARTYAWLVADPPSAATIRGRQAAVSALRGRSTFLEDCAVAADVASAVPRRMLDAFVAWSEATPDRPVGIAARAMAWVGPLLALGAIVATALGATHGMALIGPILLLNAIVTATVVRRLRTMLAGVGDLPALLGPVLAVADRIAREPADAESWNGVRERLRNGGGLTAMARLATLLRWSEMRYSPMAHWTLNALTLWDVHILTRLDAWRHASGGSARAWFDAVGDGEALVALATLAHDNPDWIVPTLDDDAPNVLAASSLGHPLLSSAKRVGNPATLGGPGSLLVVSGSNMAGKTTLLRAIGVNVLLAQAGGPVCASAMCWRRMRVRTSIHVHDALEDGVSLYLAELRRLKSIVIDAQRAQVPDESPVLYLLDEVLHGTNSADRRTATRAVLARLRSAGAVGVITTHDLELADDPALAVDTTHLHFREHYEPGPDGPRMTFDYIARDGRATSANALALLTALGLS